MLSIGVVALSAATKDEARDMADNKNNPSGPSVRWDVSPEQSDPVAELARIARAGEEAGLGDGLSKAAPNVIRPEKLATSTAKEQLPPRLQSMVERARAQPVQGPRHGRVDPMEFGRNR